MTLPPLLMSLSALLSNPLALYFMQTIFTTKGTRYLRGNCMLQRREGRPCPELLHLLQGLQQWGPYVSPLIKVGKFKLPLKKVAKCSVEGAMCDRIDDRSE